jgi:hypothetical protein
MVRKASVACVTYILQEFSDFEPFGPDPPGTTITPFPRTEHPLSVAMQGRTGAGDSASIQLSLQNHDAGSTQDYVTFAAQWLACANSCQCLVAA